MRTGGGELVDLKQRSRVIASLADFLLLRAYHDRDDSEVGSVIENIIEGEVEGCR